VNFYQKDGSSQSANLNVGKLEVPLMLGFHILGPLRMEAGPVYDWVFDANTNAHEDVKLSPSGVGYRFGASVEFWRLNLGLDYQGITNKSSGSSTSSFEMPNQLILSLALRLGRDKE
jgi:hypothetical protein